MNQEILPVLSDTTGTEHELGDKIDFDTTMEIINRIRSNATPENGCFKHIYVHLDYVAQTNHYAPAKESEIGTLRIKPNFNQDTCMKCRQNCDTTGMSPRQMADTCAKNIQYGVCRDKFMQHIIGEVLYPDFYQKQK